MLHERVGKKGKLRNVRKEQTEGEAAKATKGNSSTVPEAEEGARSLSIRVARQRWKLLCISRS